MPQEFARLARSFTAMAGFTVLAACGGGGGGGDTNLGPTGPNTPAPVISLSVTPTSIAAGQTVTVTWSSTNATSCTASGGWSGARGTSGSEASAALNATTSFTLSCSGAGGTNTATATATVVGPPTVTLTADQTALTVNYSTSLRWASTNATSCTASNGWTGSKPVSGADGTGPVTVPTTFTLTCTGLGGTTTSQPVNITVSSPPAGQVVVYGQITFDRLRFNTTLTQGLNASAPVVSPAREVLVNIAGGFTGSTVTDAGGYYAFTVPVSTSVTVSARAQMQRTGTAPTWDFRILNNTNSDALYVLAGTAFNTGTADVLRNLHAPSGWGGSSYTGTRAAAPFAILDTVYNTKQLIVGANAAAVFPPLNLYWSIDNNTASSPFCPDNGNIGTSFYFRDPSGTATDDCNAPFPDGIYILGDYANGNGDTDEFDAHVIAHEFGHYFEDRFSRSDSIGGEHGFGDRLDLRVAFGEGWGNAFGAMSLNDPQYRDSFGGLSQDFGFNLESDASTNEGWFSEASVGELLWDLFDDNAPAEPGDGVALGFGPIFATMTDEQVTTDAFTSIFSFASALRADNAGVSSAIGTLLNGEDVNGSDAFGAGETENGGDTRALPVYDDIVLNTPKNNVCSSSVAGSKDDPSDLAGNKLGNRRFLRFVNNQARTVTITATGAGTNASTVTATDPDILVWRRGVVVAASESGDPAQETLTTQLAAGTHILEVYDFDTTGTNQPPRCMTVSIGGN